MLPGSVKTKVVIFVVIALVGTSYLGASYVGFNPFASGYRVSVSLPSTGGLFENAEVTYRGVPVGEVESLRPTEDGVNAVLHINTDAPPMPEQVRVTVNNRSVIGEQYLDLRGGSLDGAKLSAGDHLAAGAEALPPRIDELIRSGRDFIASVPSDALNTVIDETYEATRGNGGNLRMLVRTSHEFADTADANFLVTAGLIQNSERVLATQQESADSIRSFSHDLNLLASTLRKTDPQWRELIATTPASAKQLGLLFKEVGAPLGVLMANLLTPARIFGVNAAGVQDAMIRLPQALSIGWAATGSKGMEMGLAQTYFDPLPCTKGYGNTEMRKGLQTGKGESFNLDSGCTMSPSSGTNVRGPEAVPERLDHHDTPTTRVRVADTLADLMGG